MAIKKHDLDNWTPVDSSNPLKSLAHEINLNLTDIDNRINALGGVGKGYAAAYVNAGTFVTLDNLKFSVTTSGNRGLSCATVSGTVTLSIAATWILTGSTGGNSTTWPGATYTTTPQGPWFEYHFPNAGDGSVYLANDYTNGKVYRITLLIGANYNNNFISIERLL
jgi:hypothetical protein